ncbi:MAG: sigma 54-interacting transcriptional regulator [Phycisphaerae bacterium]|nr:sigma 54-interacting transcriptional regulator [Phycisphaerae bacterium]
MTRTLVSWVGHADLRALAAQLPTRERNALSEIVGAVPTDPDGPIKSLVRAERFDSIHLLSNYDSRWNKRFAAWIGRNCEVHRVSLRNPTDYAAIYESASNSLASLTTGGVNQDDELCIHLSPGTPAMTAIWVLLGKTQYPATFYQTHKGKSWVTEIPFDITLDLVPKLLRQPDAHFQHLAAKGPEEVEGFGSIVGNSKAIRLAVGRAQRAAIRSVPVLLLGESGTGKEMFARAIHAASSRRHGPFIAINCAAVPRELLEAELFGYAKGAFTGAVKSKPGAFEQADGGTLFLDEIGECDGAMQAKLLRVLQPTPESGPCDRVFRPVGATADKAADVRLISATNRDLANEVLENRFREDLFYRVAVITVSLPALRDRRSDVPLLAEHLMATINQQAMSDEPGYKDKCLSDSAKAFVKQHDWPGNVRQLYNALLQAAVMSETERIDRADLAAAVTDLPQQNRRDILELPLGGTFSLEKHLEFVHKHYLRRAMSEAGGKKTQAASLLGMKNYQTLDAQLKRLGVE